MRFVLLLTACVASSTDITCPQCPRNGSTGTTSGGTTGSGGSTGGGGVADLGAMPDLAPVSCDPVTQLTCGAGQECGIGGTCQPIPATPIPHGGLCGTSVVPPQTVDNCSPGEGCFGESDGAGKHWSRCYQMCRTNSDCKQPTVAGGLPPACDSNASDPLSGCSISCDPVGAAAGTHGCASDTACYNYVDDIDQREHTDCFLPGTVGAGGSCTSDGDCTPGLNCVTPAGRCQPLCHPGRAGDCPSGTDCFPLTGSAYGICN